MKPLAPFDSNIKLLQKVLDLRSANQNVIAANIANAETPGYARAKFEFEEELQQAINKSSSPLVTTHQRHIPVGPTSLDSVTGTIHQIEDKTGIGDQNGVSVDEEMIALSENELLYETAAQILKKKLTMLNYAISEGK
ncbi:MAG: flagellar basal body rod protein FlgB [Proteobacteria bacterium]|nr:flagellar basal body rod protein FlgB [Pseudomonadota bacterium]MBU1416963.1 flagellar basal body rod protein FlgB [Pseudomonadota bacterium]MBU1454674.1 flagellar basal body rod protein FlgB [Pseudomonadota bacterium]